VKILTCLLIVIAFSGLACKPNYAAYKTWQEQAQAYLKKQGFEPIEIPKDTTFEKSTAGIHYAWQQRVLVEPFLKRSQQWPKQAQTSATFAKKVTQARAAHPEMDWSRTPLTLEKTGLALLDSAVNDPFILWATAWLAWEYRKESSTAEAMLLQASRHKLLTTPEGLALNLEVSRLAHEIRQANNLDTYNELRKRLDSIDGIHGDTLFFGPNDDELRAYYLDFLFENDIFSKNSDKVLKLAQDTRNSPWLKMWLHGRWEEGTAWQIRGWGFSNTVSADARKGFGEHQIKAREYLLEAWKIRPDLPHVPYVMLSLIRTRYGPEGDSLHLWFDRAIQARLDWSNTYEQYAWSLMPRWGGTHADLLALGYACALTERYDTPVPRQLYHILAKLRMDKNTEEVYQKMILPEVLLSVAEGYAKEPSLVWKKKELQNELGILAWAAGDYQEAYKVLSAQTEAFTLNNQVRSLEFTATETRIRGESALGATGHLTPWIEAQKNYEKHRLTESETTCEEITAALGKDTPACVKQMLTAIRFERAFAKGEWQELKASPDLENWEIGKGKWKGLDNGDLLNVGTDHHAVILFPGRVHGNFEITGEYSVHPRSRSHNGIGIALGASFDGNWGNWLGCIQEKNTHNGGMASLRNAYYTHNLQGQKAVQPFANDPWHFHILSRNEKVTYRINHQDAFNAVDPTVFSKHLPSVKDNKRIGFFHYDAVAGTTTTIRKIRIRKIEPESTVSANRATTLETLKSSYEANRKNILKDLRQQLITELEDSGDMTELLIPELQKNPESEWLADEAFLQTIEPKGKYLFANYKRSLEQRMAQANTDWIQRAFELSTEAKEQIRPDLASALKDYAHSLSTLTVLKDAEEPLAKTNDWKWQEQFGPWDKDNSSLTGKGDTHVYYLFNKRPPFQLDFTMTVLQGMRPRVHVGSLMFANEGYQPTLSLYPGDANRKKQVYEKNKAYQVTIKITAQKSELLIDGEHVCNGQGVRDVVPYLSFRGGDWWSRGTTRFENIRVSPLSE
jgi:hypothetical protein